MKMRSEEEEDKALEYKIEEERAKLKADDCTPVTKETFEAWHKKRREKLLKKRKEKDAEVQASTKGKNSKVVFLSGRALMKFDASIFKNDEDDDDDEEDKYEKKEEDNGEEIHELRFGLDEEELELEKEIEAAKGMKIDQELFDDEGVDEVDLDDLE